MKKPNLLYAGAGLLVVFAISIGTFLKGSGGESEGANQTASIASALSIPLETIGQNDVTDTEQVGSSWPGEVISSGDVEVQPQREGTIVEWRVKIGQKVSQGQVLARLSAPPATPELTRALAEQAQSLTRAKATAEAQATFVEKNKQQLNDLRTQIVTSGKQISDSLSDNTSSDRSQSVSTLQASLDASRRDTEIKAQTVKDYSTQAIRKVFPAFTNYSADPITAYKQYPQSFYFNLKYGLGGNDGNVQTDYHRNLVEAVKAIINNEDGIGEKTMRFLQSADNLVANSYLVDGSTDGLIILRNIVSDERAELSEKIAELSEAKTETRKIESDLASKKTDFSLSAANSSKETAEKLKDIDEKLIDLDRQLQLARAEAEGAGVAYYTISNALTGGLNITAPRAGIVSIITKKSGDFVNPGTAVASINSANAKDRIVRFRIPGNITPPKAGETLTVIRPGFPKDGKKIKLAGIGVSLDSNGSFLADADFVEPIDWPVHASVRVLASAAQSGQALVSLSAVWWDDDGHPAVWLVTEENRIRPQEVKTGRTLGDKIEILEGLAQGSRIVSKATSDLKAGTQLDQLSSTPKNKTEDQPQDESQPHGHDE